MILKIGGWVDTRQFVRLIKYNTQIKKRIQNSQGFKSSLKKTAKMPKKDKKHIKHAKKYIKTC